MDRLLKHHFIPIGNIPKKNAGPSSGIAGLVGWRLLLWGLIRQALYFKLPFPYDLWLRGLVSRRFAHGIEGHKHTEALQQPAIRRGIFRTSS